jgi:hypothetical protein
MELSAGWHVVAIAIELVVYGGDGMTIGQKPAAQMGADKTCATGDDNLHDLAPPSSPAAALSRSQHASTPSPKETHNAPHLS